MSGIAAAPLPILAAPAEPFRRTALAASLRLIALRLLLVAAFLLVWEYLPSDAARFWASRPSLIIVRLASWFADGSIWPHIGATLSASALGYALGCASGIASGLLLGFLPRVQLVLSPYLSAIYALPKIALAPLLIILLGIGLAPKVALAGLTVFFILLNATLDGVRDVDDDLVCALRLMGARRSELIAKTLIPAALPWIFSGMRISVRYAFTGTLLAELIAANRGLGFLIEYNSGNFDATGAYAAILVVVVFSVLLTEILSKIETSLSTARH